MKNFFACLLFSLAMLVAPAGTLFFGQNVAIGGGAAYEGIEDFEGVLLDSQGGAGYTLSGWNSIAAGTTTPGDTTAPISEGSKCLRLEANGGDYHSMTAADTKEVAFRFYYPTFISNDTTVEVHSGATTLGYLRLRTDGPGSGNQIRLEQTGGSNGAQIGPDNTSGTSFTANTWYYGWLVSSKATGGGGNAVMALRVSTTTTRPSSAGSSSTNGTWTSQVDRIYLGGFSTAGVRYDRVVWDTSVGSNP